MLGSSFEGLDVENTESLKQTLTDMVIGMSIIHIMTHRTNL